VQWYEKNLVVKYWKNRKKKKTVTVNILSLWPMSGQLELWLDQMKDVAPDGFTLFYIYFKMSHDKFWIKKINDELANAKEVHLGVKIEQLKFGELKLNNCKI
jgi:hypothetical protein